MKLKAITLIAISLILIILIYSYDQRIQESHKNVCDLACSGESTNNTCPHEEMTGFCPYNKKVVSYEAFFGFLISLILFILGVYELIKKERGRELGEEEREKRFKEIYEKSDENEKKILELLKENEWVMFQSEIVEKTGFSKAKVSRILDKLEAKGYVERRRRGMSNVIIMK